MIKRALAALLVLALLLIPSCNFDSVMEGLSKNVLGANTANVEETTKQVDSFSASNANNMIDEMFKGDDELITEIKQIFDDIGVNTSQEILNSLDSSQLAEFTASIAESSKTTEAKAALVRTMSEPVPSDSNAASGVKGTATVVVNVIESLAGISAGDEIKITLDNAELAEEVNGILNTLFDGVNTLANAEIATTESGGSVSALRDGDSSVSSAVESYIITKGDVAILQVVQSTVFSAIEQGIVGLVDGKFNFEEGIDIPTLIREYKTTITSALYTLETLSEASVFKDKGLDGALSSLINTFISSLSSSSEA